jgi:acyl-CoA dehydrogenase
MNVRGITVQNFRVVNKKDDVAAEIARSDGHIAAADLNDRAQAVAGVAAQTAVAVDREARFPHEALAAARSQRLLGTLVPHELGGEGANLSDVVDVCYASDGHVPRRR